MDKKHLITNIVTSMALLAGIIITSIGGIMIISSSLKLSLFDSKPYSTVSKEDCRYDYYKLHESGDTKNYQMRSPEEIDICVTERKAQNLEQFQNSQKRNIIDGVSALIVGGLLLFFSRRKKK